VPGGSTGFHALCYQVGLERFCLWTHEHRDLIEAVLDRYAAENVRWSETVARKRLCPLFFLGDDIACKERLIFSPDFLRDTFIGALRRVCAPLGRAGIKVIFHSDGDVTEVLDDMIEARIDGLHPVEPLAGMDIAFLKKRYGKRLILVGNVDSSQLLPFGSVGEIREAVRRCIRAVSPGGGHFLGSSGEITPAIPLGNVLAFYEAARQFGRYPLTPCA